jgi:hypothetical protein
MKSRFDPSIILLYIAVFVEQYCDIMQANALPENEGILERRSQESDSPFQDYPREEVIFKSCACRQTRGYKPAENLWRAWRRLPHPAEHSSGKPPLVGADAPLDRSFIEGERRPQGASGVTPARRRFNFRRNNPRIFAGMTQQNRVAKHARTQKTGFSPD